MVERSNLAQSFQDVSKSFLVSLSAMIWNHRELYPVSQLTHDEFLGHHQPAQVPRELCDGPVPLDAGDRALELSIEMIASEFLDGFSGGAPAVKKAPKLHIQSYASTYCWLHHYTCIIGWVAMIVGMLTWDSDSIG